MALPSVKSSVDIEFSNAVSPYIPQLYDLFQQIFQSASDPQALKQLYLSTNPLISAFAFSLFLAPIFLVISEINKNYSQVDRFWSILPTIYNAHYAIYAHALGLPTRRLDTVLVLSTLWSVG
jgi:steroid 5-alpha reductase family enzyme